jgi:ribosomal protein S18 acetylase RimI-like enzyme
MKISVRAASGADLDALVRLNQVGQRLHADLEPTYFRAMTDDAEVSAFVAARLAAPENYIRLAEYDGRSAGCIWFEKQERPETPFTLPRKRIYVHHIAVDEAAQRRGVASALLRHAEPEALASGIRRVVLDTWAANQAARAVFGSQGQRRQVQRRDGE